MVALNDLWRSWLTSQLGASTGDAITGLTATHTADNTVTSASEVILAANAARKGFIIQNVDDTDNVRVRLAGSAATITNGLQIKPSGSLTMMDPGCYKGEIRAIREGAADTVVHVVEFT